MQIDTLKEYWQNAGVLADGYEFEYRSYTFRKVGGGGSTELALYNPAGKKVESYTASAFDSFSAFKQKVDQLIAYGPDDLEDWLNRAQ